MPGVRGDAIAMIVMALEERFGIEIPDEALAEKKSGLLRADLTPRFIEATSELGRAAGSLLGPDFHQVDGDEEDPEPSYFAGDLYFWWLEHGKKYQAYALLDDWLSRDFAREVAIPMYVSAAENRD